MGEQEINLEQEAVIVQQGGGAVNSVNGQTGDVILTTSDLENTSDYQTGSEVESAISEAISELPTVNDATLTIQKNGASVGTFTANDADNATINITVPTSAADVSALPASTKYGASISVSIDSSTYVMTTQLKDQDGNNLGSAQTVDLPLESVVVNGSYDSTNKKIILTLQNGNTIDIPVADLVSGLQTEITSDNKLSAALVDDTSTTNKFVTASEKSTWNAKQDALTAGANITIEEESGTGNTVISATDTTYTAGTNVQITNGTISATDTTYSNFVGTDGVSAGSAGLVPAPAAADADKFLKSDGTWDTAGGGGSSTFHELSASDYNANSSNWNDTDPANFNCIAAWLLPLGFYKCTNGIRVYWTKVWSSAYDAAHPYFGVVNNSVFGTDGDKNIMMFSMSNSSTSLGQPTGLFTFTVYSNGNSPDAYNSTDGGPYVLRKKDIVDSVPTSHTPANSYKVLSAEQGYVMGQRIQAYGTSAPTTSTFGVLGGLKPTIESGTPHLYMCTAVSGSTYTWTQLI